MDRGEGAATEKNPKDAHRGKKSGRKRVAVEPRVSSHPGWSETARGGGDIAEQGRKDEKTSVSREKRK